MTCKCKCRLDASVYNGKKRWDNDKCRCECKELIEKFTCDKGVIWNPSNCRCECDKSCDVGEYLDHANCKCRKRLINKLAEECSEIIDEVKIAKIISVELRLMEYYSAECNFVKNENDLNLLAQFMLS